MDTDSLAAELRRQREILDRVEAGIRELRENQDRLEAALLGRPAAAPLRETAAEPAARPSALQDFLRGLRAKANRANTVRQARSRKEMEDYLLTPEVVGRQDADRTLAADKTSLESWLVPGYCEACRDNAEFFVDWLYSAGGQPNYRERLVCQRCFMNSRQRYMLGFARDIVERIQKPRPTVYLYEQDRPFFRKIASILSDAEVIGSEYFGADVPGGTYVDGIRHENALALSFKTGSTDLIISNDVFEHVPDIQQALREATRILAPGGKLMISVPFTWELEETEYRAIVENGAITYLKPPEYHGSPEPQNLVYHDYGWDLLDFCKRAGFTDAYMQLYYSRENGYFSPHAQFLFVAEKNA